MREKERHTGDRDIVKQFHGNEMPVEQRILLLG